MADKQPMTLQRYFAGLAENTFQVRLGVVDPPIVDYLTDLLLRFVRSDAVNRVRSPAGRRLQAIGDMLREAEARVGVARRDVHRHIGDYTLFWAGLYPEALRPRRGPASDDGYQDFCVHGKHAYFVASTIESDEDTEREAPAFLLKRLSDQFEMCCYGLREIRREWETSDGFDGMLLN